MQPGYPMSVPTAFAGEKESGPSIGPMLWRIKWLLLLGALVGAGLGYLYFMSRDPVFQSDAQIMVVQRHSQLPDDPARYDRDANLIQTQAFVLTSEAVMRRAVEEHGLAERLEFGTAGRALDALVLGLEAVPERGADILSVSYQGKTPEECHAVLDAVVKSYREYLGETEQDVSQETVRYIAQAKDELLKDLQRLEDEYREFRQQAPLIWKGEETGGINVHAARLADIAAERTEVLLEISQLQAKVDAIEEALRRGGSREALTLMVQQVRADDGNQLAAIRSAERLFPLLMEREILASKGLGADHPQVQSIEKQIAVARAHFDELFGSREVVRQPKDLLDLYLESLRHEIDAAKGREEKLAAMFDEEQAASRALDAYQSRDQQFRREIAQKTQMFDVVVKRLDEMSLFDSAGLRTQVLLGPTAGYQTSIALPVNMAIGAALGLMLATGLGYLIEVNDLSFRSPEDVREQIGVPVIGHVPVITGRDGGSAAPVAPVLCTVHKPKSRSSEAFRLVRTSLFFSTRGSDVRVIQVTSPDQGDGKSTLAANLAVAIATSGRKTLLIDADMRRPTIHSLFRISGEGGLAAIIGNGGEPSDAIRESAVPNLSIVPCEKRPHNPAELLSSDEFDQFLAWARDRFEFVIVDTPPLLAVSDPGAVASRADGVILALRLGKKVRAKAAESREILDRVGATILGVVINGVNAKGDYGYRYSNAAYGTRYGYAYTDRGSAYYAEDPHVAAGHVMNGKAGRY